jgi:hypothetical protein
MNAIQMENSDSAALQCSYGAGIMRIILPGDVFWSILSLIFRSRAHPVCSKINAVQNDRQPAL